MAMCADYRRKIPWAPITMLLERQAADARELRQDARDWAGESTVEVYRCEIGADGIASFATLE